MNFNYFIDILQNQKTQVSVLRKYDLKIELDGTLWEITNLCL